MKISELRFGNWVKNGLGQYVKVRHIISKANTAGYNSETLQPIILTPEILEKAGFERLCDGNEYRIGLPLGHGTDLVVEVVGEPEGPYDVNINDRPSDQLAHMFSYVKSVKYLHRLQNLFHAITGQELDINL